MNAKRRQAWVASAIHGDRTRGTGILNNPTYNAEIVWGRSVWKRSAVDSQRRRWELQSDRAATVRYHDERLRIVPADLWERVQARQREVAKASDAIRKALHARARTGRTPKHLLTGLLRCGRCGAGFVMNGTNGHEAYACGTRINSGAAAYDNHLRIAKDMAESRFVAGLHAELLKPARVELFKREVRRIMAAKASDGEASEVTRRDRMAKLEAAELEKTQLEQAATARTGRSAFAKVAKLLPQLGSTYQSMVTELVRNLRRDVARARLDLAGIVGRLTLKPDPSGQFLIADGRIELGGLLAAPAIFGNVVAGA